MSSGVAIPGQSLMSMNALFVDVEFSAAKFTAALTKFAENDKQQMVS